MDYRVVNIIASFIALVTYFFYVRSGKYQELKTSLSLIAVCIGYFGAVYSIAIIFEWDTIMISAWLRPPFSVDRIMLALLFVDLVWGDDIYKALQYVKSKITWKWRSK